MEIFYYIVSIFAIILFVSSVQFKNKKDILMLQFGANVCYLLVYLTRLAWVGVSSQGLTAVKNFIFIIFEHKKKDVPLWLLLLFLGGLIGISIYFYDGILSLVPLLINILLFISTTTSSSTRMSIPSSLNVVCKAVSSLTGISSTLTSSFLFFFILF